MTDRHVFAIKISFWLENMNSFHVKNNTWMIICAIMMIIFKLRQTFYYIEIIYNCSIFSPRIDRWIGTSSFGWICFCKLISESSVIFSSSIFKWRAIWKMFIFAIPTLTSISCFCWNEIVLLDLILMIRCVVNNYYTSS